MHTISFRMKMFISFGVLAIVCLIPALMYFHSFMGSIAIQDAERRAATDMKVLVWLLKQRSESAPLQDLDRWIKDAGAEFGLRITYLEHGVVLADSEVSAEQLATLEDHSSRPEVLQALSAGVGMAMRHSATLGQSLLYVARVLEPGLGAERGVLRLAIPLAEVQAEQRRLLRALNWLVPVTLCAMLLLGLWLSRSLTRSILEFSNTASAIGQGDYARRLFTSPGREFLPLQQSVNTMADRIQDTIKGLEEQKGELEALFNGLSEGVLLLDAAGVVESWNQSFCRIFKDNAVRQGMHLLEASMEPFLHQAVQRVLAGGGSAESMALQRGGEEYEVSITPFKDAHAVRKLVLVFRDVTKLRRLERVRRDFVANASHEMRTPLTTIAGYAETLLEQDRLDETMARKFLGIIHKAAWRMAGFVENMLALSRIEAGAWQPVLVAQPLVPLLEELLEEIRPKAEQHGVDINWRVTPADLLVQADDEGLKTVLTNLLENAVRYSAAGDAVTVEADMAAGRARIAVMDQGPGVPPEIRHRVFERFYRGTEQGRRRSSGAGLGLAICKHMVQSMGGSIRVEEAQPSGQTEEGANERADDRRGARFVVELPLGTEDEEVPAQETEETGKSTRTEV